MQKIFTSGLRSFMISMFISWFQFTPSSAQTADLGLNFDGVDDRVTINTVPAYNIGTGNFTIEAWIKMDPLQPTNWLTPVFGNIDSSTQYTGLMFGLVQGAPYLKVQGIYIWFYQGLDLRDNYCHYFAVTRSGGNITFYIDGQNYFAGVLTGSINSTHAFGMGRYEGGVSTIARYKGLIHETRFWNVARTTSQIQSATNTLLTGTENGLIGYWRMNDNSGQTVNDFSLQNNDGFLGAVTGADAADPVYAAGCRCTPVASITAGGPATFCTGSNVVLTANSGAGYTYQWKNNATAIIGATSQSYSATTAGTFRCQVTASGCQGISNYISTATEQPLSPSISQSGTVFCSSSPPVNLHQSVPGGIYQWYEGTHYLSGANQQDFLVGRNSTYSCTVSNSCGTFNSAPYTVNDPGLSIDPLGIISANGSLAICTGTSVTLSVTDYNHFYSYQWLRYGNEILGATGGSYAATLAGDYACRMVDVNCNMNYFSNWLTVTIAAGTVPTASISAAGATTFCSGSSVLLQAVTGPWTYQWYKNSSSIYGATSANYTATVSGNYFCRTVNNCGTAYSGNITVTVNLAPSNILIYADGDTTFCSGDSVLLYAYPAIVTGYQWKNNGVNIIGATGPQYRAKASGNYTCLITTPLCGSAINNTKIVTVNALPSASITPAGPVAMCAGGSIVLNVPSGANKIYQWKKGGVNITGATASSYTATTGGIYKVTVTNSVTGCSRTTASATVVTVNPMPAATITPQGPTTFCAGGSVLLKGNSGTGLTYKWKKNNAFISGATSKNYTATAAGTYKIQVTNSYGCTKLSQGVVVTVPCKLDGSEDENTLDVNVYPNPSSGDFTFEINADHKNISIAVYDVAGKLIFINKIIPSKFTIRDSELAPGFYAAVITDGERKKTVKLVKMH